MKIKRYKPACFMIELEVWDANILVVCDIKPKELPKKLASLKYPKELIKLICPKYKEFKEGKNYSGLSVELAKDERRTHAIFLKEANDSWPFWDIVIHEAHHKTLDITQNKSANLEYEGSAYTQSAIIREIRRNLKLKVNP